jgi:uncharacterized protein (TIGR00290 family)
MARYAVMWSGGKDSALALERARERSLEVAALLNFIDAASGRVRFHATRRELIAAQAAAIGVPLRQLPTTWEEFPGTFEGALDALAREGYAGVVFGDIHLADVRAWYEERVRGAGLDHVEPLWGDPPAELLREFASRGGRAVITCCELAKLDERWLGRVIDETSVEEMLREPIDPCGENGEYHSFAFAGAAFQEQVPWMLGERHRESGFLQVDLLDPIAEAARGTLAAHPDLARATFEGRPKAWGRLAAQGLVAYRELVGRPLRDDERRAVWRKLWRDVHAIAPKG